MSTKKKTTRKPSASAKEAASPRPWYADQFRQLFADVIAHLSRGRNRMTREQLALMLGTDTETLTALERGIVTPRGQLLRALLPLFEVQRQYRQNTTTTRRKK